MKISPQRRREIVDALRRGTVPRSGLDAFAVGLDPFVATLDEELNTVRASSSVFKAVRGEYGCGKTFFSRWLAERAKRLGFATSEVQISETETPLYRVETVYRRMIEQLATANSPRGAIRNILDSWFYTLEQDVLAEGNIDANDEKALLEKTNALLEQRLALVTEVAPTFSHALRGYREAQLADEIGIADGIVAWLSGQPHVSAAVKRYAKVKGDLDHFTALAFLQGLLTVLRDSGHAGLLLVLDEVETLQRMRSDVRDKSLNALRQLIDEVDSGKFPGLYLMITGTSAFFDGPQGVKRLEPLSQRLHVDFQTEARFDNPRAVQIRLSPFNLKKLQLVGQKVRDIYATDAQDANRIMSLVDDDYIAVLSKAVTGKLGGKVGIAPRVFLKKLVSDILDRVDQFGDFDPNQHYSLTISDAELTSAEKRAATAYDVDDIELDL